MSEQKDIADIINRLSDASIEIASNYSAWFVADALAFIFVGIVLVCLGVYNFKRWESIGYDEDQKFLRSIVSVIVIFIGMMFVAGDVGDLVSPQGKAIHQLITDIRGN